MRIYQRKCLLCHQKAELGIDEGFNLWKIRKKAKPHRFMENKAVINEDNLSEALR